MSLMYKPDITLMSPNNTTINNLVQNTFSTILQGTICTKYIFNILYQSPSSVWQKIYNTADVISSLSNPIYNGEQIDISLTANAIGSISSGIYLSYQLGWQIRMLGSQLVGTTSGDILNVPNHQLQSGDEVYFQSKPASADSNVCYVSALNQDQLYVYSTRQTAITFSSTGRIPISEITGKPFYPSAQSRIVTFKALNPSTMNLITKNVTTESYTFVPTFTNPTIINQFEAFLYDSNKNLLDSSGIIYNTNVQYMFEGLLNGSSYYVQFTAIDRLGYDYNTGQVLFNVTYTIPTINFKPQVTNLCNESSMLIEWADAISVVGVKTGTTTYIQDYIYQGNKALKMSANATLKFTTNIPKESPPLFIFNPLSDSYTGVIVKLENATTSSYAQISYENSAFYVEIDGQKSIIKVGAIKANTVYLVGFLETTAIVNEIFTF